jgi:hypothetical protein
VAEAGRSSKLPPPPAELPRLRRTDLRPIPAGTLAWRIYRAGGPHPTAWNELRRHGPTATGRFDHQEPPPHDDPERGILYVSLGALGAVGALAEAFQETRTIDRRRQDPWLVGFQLDGDLTALDLTRLWPTRAGASQAIATGRRETAQAWSRAVYRSYAGVEALLYRSSMAGGALNLALYERAERHVPRSPTLHLPLTHPGLALPLSRAAAKLGYGLR